MIDDPFRAALNRMLAEATADLQRRFHAEHPEFQDLQLEYDTAPLLSVQRHTGYVPVSLELMVESGAISGAEARTLGWTPPPRPPWYRRARWRFQEWRERVGRKVGGWIAGVDLTEREEDW